MCVLVAQSCPTLCDPVDYSLPGSSVPRIPHGVTIEHQAPLSMEFSRKEYWSRWPLFSPRDLPDPGIEPWSRALQADSLPGEPPGRLTHVFSLYVL